ncbi:MAG: hypothetical protein FJY95_09930 [Candidatus Handelsmanbacteria bacterium]|nr:hypothetical protein [Candidatus Handelsmanbacteria bacterium]
MNTKYARILLTALSISALVLAGCSADDEDTRPTGPGNTGGTGGGATLNAGNIGAVQSPIVTTVAKAIVQGSGTYPGAKGGTLAVTRTSASLTSVSYNVVFTGYSGDGLLFIDGPLSIETILANQSTKIAGELNLSGTYSAKLGLDLTTTNNVTTGTITVDGQRFPISG